MHLPEFKNIKSLYNLRLILPNHRDFYEEIMVMYPDSTEYNEKLYRYLHNINERPICPVCGNFIPYRNSPAGYGKYCSAKCMGMSKERKNKILNSKLEKYGNPYYNNSVKATNTMNEKYGGRGFASNEIYEKQKQTCLNKFGVDNVFKLQKFQDKGCETKTKKYGNPHYSNRDKSKQTCINRYDVDNPMKSKNIHEKFTNTMLNKYGVKYAMLNKDLVNKLSESLIKAHNDGKYDVGGRKKSPSKIEKQFKQYLEDNNINYIFQYRSNEYPYLCDFYIPDYNLYIEIQGNWTHGKHAYTGDDEDLEIINVWKNKHTKFYDHAIYVWSELDVKKRKIAKNNNLNYLEIYSIKIDECISSFENKINEIKHG
jgi:predicted nucleic acid-binding Zn ribbon protein